jgi:hypothetical protein
MDNFVIDDVRIYFEVNMDVQRDNGFFSPENNDVYVRGTFDGWGNGVQLSMISDSDDNLIYSGFIDFPDFTIPGTVDYKFVFLY